MLPVALILHLAMSMWMYGDPSTLKSDIIGLEQFVGRPLDRDNQKEMDAAYA